MLRRRRPHPSLASFLRMADRLDAAQRALLGAIPTARDPGIPLEDALALFDRELSAAEALMPDWRRPDVVGLHDRCAGALARAKAEADRLRGERDLGFEALNLRVGDVLIPLEEVADAERALRRGSTSSGT